MKRINLISSVLLLLSLFTSCKDTGFKYLMVKYEGEKLWSVVKVSDGKELCRDEIVGEPSMIINGIFTIRDKKGYYQYYDVNNLKKPIVDTKFVYATPFTGDGERAMAVVKDGNICVVDRECRIVKDLGKKIRTASYFIDGVAIVMNEKEKCGLVDESGDVIANTEWDEIEGINEGKAIAVKKEGENAEARFYVINLKGEKQFQIKSNYYPLSGFSEGLIACKGEDGKLVFFNEKGDKELTIHQSDANDMYSSVGFSEGVSVYKNSDGNYGLIDKNGEVTVSAKYEMLQYLKEKTYVAKKDEKYGIINNKGEEILGFNYKDISWMNLESDHYLVKEEKSYYIVDKKGKDCNKEGYDEVCNDLCYIAKSDYVDVQGIAEVITGNLNNSSWKGIGQDVTAQKIAAKLSLTDPENYSYSYNFSDSETIMGDLSCEITYSFSSNVAEEISHTQYETYFGYVFSQRVSDGYRFTQAPISCVSETISLSKHPGHSKEVAKVIEKVLENKGFLKVNDGIYEADGHRVGVESTDDEVRIAYNF